MPATHLIKTFSSHAIYDQLRMRIFLGIGMRLKNELRYNFADCAQLQEIQMRFTCGGMHLKGRNTMAISGATQIYSSLAAAKPKFIKFHQAGSPKGFWPGPQRHMNIGKPPRRRRRWRKKNIFRSELLKICKWRNKFASLFCVQHTHTSSHTPQQHRSIYVCCSHSTCREKKKYVFPLEIWLKMP